MRYRSLMTTTAAFLAVVLSAGVWVGAASRITDGGPGLVISVLGGLFSALFMWLLVARLRSLLANPDRMGFEVGALAVNVAILIFTFAWVHHRIGLVDMSGGTPHPADSFGDALYFSVVTITTLGYGDFIPVGAGRSIAALQALMGYVILGILVSTGFQLIAPHIDLGTGDGDASRPDPEPTSDARADR